jgi:hypothetical protein
MKVQARRSAHICFTNQETYVLQIYNLSQASNLLRCASVWMLMCTRNNTEVTYPASRLDASSKGPTCLACVILLFKAMWPALRVDAGGANTKQSFQNMQQNTHGTILSLCYRNILSHHFFVVCKKVTRKMPQHFEKTNPAEIYGYASNIHWS